MQIIQQIIEMDNAAAARVNAAVEEERKLSDGNGEGSVKAREEAVAAEKAKTEEFCKEQMRILNEKLSKAEEILAAECGKLDEKFAANKDKWKAEIIGRITEG